MIHRDIKPTNVLVAEIDGKEVAKLADVGVARVYQTAPFSGLSFTTGLLDLASFIPPEILFSFQEANPLADQYSLAAVMYHLLTGAAVLDLPRKGQRRYSSLLRSQHARLTNCAPTCRGRGSGCDSQGLCANAESAFRRHRRLPRALGAARCKPRSHAPRGNARRAALRRGQSSPLHAFP